ncbi:hypothetical protein HMPREF1870_00196 [Bacteroidales bacterium KA00344]|nr:hypothetical protein HMPREF1870_00196 [Bacteroidales bacterium KA00344]
MLAKISCQHRYDVEKSFIQLNFCFNGAGIFMDERFLLPGLRVLPS